MKIETSKRYFDIAKIIIDPKKLIVGKEYYSSNCKGFLKMNFEDDFGFKVFNGRISDNGLSGIIDGNLQEFFYPREPKFFTDFTPYDIESMTVLQLKKLLDLPIYRYEDHRILYIASIVISELIGINIYDAIADKYTVVKADELLKNYYWKDGSPCGVEVKECKKES